MMAEASCIPDSVVPDPVKPRDDTVTACLQASMKIGKLTFNVSLDERGLSWVKRGKTADKAVTVPIDEILSVSTISEKTSDGCQVIGFTVGCVRHMKKHILRREMVQFLCDSEEGMQWSEKIQHAMKQVTRRPKRVLVIINPESGSKSGRKVYDSKVAGLFKQANIDTDVVVTERAHHCEQILTEYDLSDIDGIVLLGGDGLYHEAVNGLQKRLIKEAGLDVNDSSISLPKVPVPIGLIPTGTGNGTAAACYGCVDVETATLSIIIGKTVDGNLLAIYSLGELISFSCLLLGYGVWGDLIYAAETKRSQGRLRYATALMSTIFIQRHRQTNFCFDYLSPARSPEEVDSEQLVLKQDSEQSRQDSPGVQGDSERLISDEQERESQQEKVETCQAAWKTGQGVYSALMIFVKDYWSDCEKTPATEDCTRLILNKPCRALKLLQFLLKLMTYHPQALDSCPLDHMQVKEVKVKVNVPSGENTEDGRLERILDVDGEIFYIKQPECHIVFHPRTVPLFGVPKECSS